MAGSFKDALQKSGIVKEEPTAPPVEKANAKWREELPDPADDKPHIPFDAPALTKPKSSKKP